MKRQFNLLASVLLVIAMVFAFASCDIIGQYIPGINQPEPEHEHSYVDGKCECGEADPNYVAPHEHSYVDGKCECGEADPNYKAPHEHSYVDGKCECGEADPNYKPECTEHTYGEPEVIKAATCTESGEEKYTCSACGATETSEIAPLGHDLKTIAGSEPTCTEPGLTDGKQCKVCGEITLEQAELGAKGHEYVDGVCSRCDAKDPDYKGPVTYVFDAQNLAELSASASNLGKVLEGEIDEFFTFYMSDKTKIESGKKATFEDGYSVTSGLRLNLNGASDINTTPEGATEPINKNVLMFSIPDGHTATVKVWWTCGGDGRELAIFDEEENIVAASKHNDPYAENEGTGSAKNSTYVDTLSIESDGIFYLGTDNTGAVKNGGNIWWKVEVTVTPVEEAPANEIKVETTDTYCWVDEYTFTADAEGYYTFHIPAGLGFWTAKSHDSNKAPEVDFQIDEGGDVVVGLKAEQSITFYIGAFTKDEWIITWSFEEGEVKEDEPSNPPSTEIDTELELGNNSIYAPAGASGTAVECTFVVTEEGTYTFSSNDLMAIITIDELTSARGQAYLTPGTYVVNVIYYTTAEGSYNLKIEFSAPATGEPDGSEQYPFVWETLPESVTFESDNMNMIYYVFTATADGSVTFTWAVEENDWFNYFELVEGQTTENNASGFAKTSHTFVVEAGKTYRVGLGTWNEGGETVVSIAFSACAHEWSQATCEALSTCSKCGATTGDKAEHTSSGEPTCAKPEVCTVCGFEMSTANHTYGEPEVITPADCAKNIDGSQKLTCTVCGHEEIETIYAYHAWDRSQCVEATCTTDGKYHAVCTVCGTIDSYDIEAKGHYNWYASCGDTTTCMACGETFTLEHDLFPADCFSAAQCSICWQYFGEPLPHNYVDGVCTECFGEDPDYVACEHSYEESVTTNPTCTTEGVKTFTCSSCGDSYTEAIEATGVHSYEESVTTNPTCTTEGVKTFTCSSCNHSYTEAIAATGVHSYGESVTTNATCTTEGVKTFTCSSCNHSYTEPIAKTEHADNNGDFKCDTCSTKMLPADGEALTIAQAIAVAKLAGSSYTTQKYYITGIINEVYDTTYGNMYIEDEDGNEICIYGLYTWGNDSSNGTRYDKMDYKPLVGDEITVYTILGTYNNNPQGKNAWIDEVVAHEHNANDATCTTPSVCTICGNTVAESTGHSYVSGTCSVCGASENAIKVYSHEFTKSVYSANSTQSLNGVDWTLAGNGGYWGYDSNNGRGQQFGSGSKPYTSMTLTSEEFTNVSKIVINTSGAKDIKGTLVITVGGVKVGELTLTSSATSYTFTCDNLDGPIVLSYTQTTSKAIYIKSIEVTYN